MLFQAMIGMLPIAETKSLDKDTAIKKIAQQLDQAERHDHLNRWRAAGFTLVEIQYTAKTMCAWCSTPTSVYWNEQEICCVKCKRTSYRVVLPWSKPWVYVN